MSFVNQRHNGNPTSPQRLKVFLCHSSNDKPAVRNLYQRLLNDGFEPWLDEEDIRPGEPCEDAILRAIDICDIALICLSQNSVSKRGYVQKEIAFVLDALKKQPENTIFLIPVKLEECNVPHSLSKWQWVNLFEENGYDRLLRTLRAKRGDDRGSSSTSKHIICLAMLPFKASGNFDYEEILLPALKETLELEPHYWQVIRGDDQYYSDVIDLNVEAWMRKTQAYVFDISDKEPDISRILERLYETKQREHPLIVLQRQDTQAYWTPRPKAIYVRYPAFYGSHAKDDTAEFLKNELKEKFLIQQLNQKRQYCYLSPRFLKDICVVPEQHVKALTSAFKTIEEFCAANPEEICLKVPGLSRPSAEEYQSNAKKAVALP
jgi:hypothetical protein